MDDRTPTPYDDHLSPWVTQESTGRRQLVPPRHRQWDRAEALRAWIGDRSVVYAIRLKGGTIKIGWTHNLRTRRNHWIDSEILGWSFGDYADEQAIHATLRDHVAHGREYYHPTPEVLAVINAMRADLGLDALVA